MISCLGGDGGRTPPASPTVGKDQPPDLAFLVPSETPKKVTQNQAYDNNYSLLRKYFQVSLVCEFLC